MKKIFLGVVFFWPLTPWMATASILEFECPKGHEVVEGLNKNWKTHRWVKRTFHAEFPDVKKDTPVGVIFSWHGAGDSMQNWRARFPIASESSSQFPFIVITPHDVGLTPHGDRKGLSWDLFKSRRGDDNLEAKLFESVLGCLSKTHNILPSRIYSAGFSAGAMVSNMLYARYPQHIAAVFSASGVWLNDLVQRDMFHFPFGMRIAMDWDELSLNNHGAFFMTDGGDKDIYTIFMRKIMSFHEATIRSVEFLSSYNRTVVACEHEAGHRLHPGMHTGLVARFFRAHSAGEPSLISEVADLPPVMRGCTLKTLN